MFELDLSGAWLPLIVATLSDNRVVLGAIAAAITILALLILWRAAAARATDLAMHLAHEQQALEARTLLLEDARDRRVQAETRAESYAAHSADVQLRHDKLQAEFSQADRERAEMRVQLQAGQEMLKRQRAEFEQISAQMTDKFSALSLEALRANNQSFLDQAKLTFEQVAVGARTDLAAREKAVADLVSPVREALGKVDLQIQEMERARTGAYEGLRQLMGGMANEQERLRRETGSLVTALRAPQARGRWGEIQLRRVVEMAGMLAHCDFTEQHTVSGETGALRPDMIVHLPGGKTIIVDAKTPLEGYLDAANPELSDAERALAMGRHARHVRQHLKMLGDKGYANQFQDSPDFVVLFMPGEAFFSAALQHDPALIEEGAARNVILATPTTLIALLRAVHYGWRQEKLAENARAISTLGAELHDRVAVMGAHMAKLGKALDGGVNAYNDAVGSLERNVLTSARKLRDLHVETKKDMPELPSLDGRARTLQKLDASGEL
jgi:DNA recombination protein RmuC